MSRRKFLHVAGMSAGGLLLAACGADGSTETTAAPTTAGGAGTTATTIAGGGGTPPQSTISDVNLDFNTPNITLQAPFWIGQTLGFFEEVGINSLNITQSDDPITPLAAGSVHVALLDSIILFSAEHESNEQGEPLGITYTSCVFGAQPMIMIGAEGVTADNLEGRTIGGAREGSVNEAIARFILEELGYDPDSDVDLRNLTGGSNDWVTAMLTGQIDATVAFPRHIPVAEAEGGSALFVESDPIPQNGYGVLRSTLDEHPDFAVAWTYAYIQAQRWCKDADNYEEMRRIIVEEHGLDYPDNAWEVRDIDNELMTQDMGFVPDQMSEHLNFVAPFVSAPQDLPWRDYTDVSFLHQAQELHGLDTNPTADLTDGQNLTDAL